MAFPTAVNDQITDSVTQANSSQPRGPINGASYELMGNIIKALGVATQKGVTDQQQAAAVFQAAAIMGISLLYTVETKGETITKENIIGYLKELIESCNKSE